jgi:hypothetical protein
MVITGKRRTRKMCLSGLVMATIWSFLFSVTYVSSGTSPAGILSFRSLRMLSCSAASVASILTLCGGENLQPCRPLFVQPPRW